MLCVILTGGMGWEKKNEKLMVDGANVLETVEQLKKKRSNNCTNNV